MILTASIVVYKTPEPQLKEVIQSFMQLCNKSYKLIVVDNSPNNNLKELVLKNGADYIHNPSNPGYGAAHNIAIKISKKSGAKYHLVLNPDISFGEKVIPELLEFMENNPNVGNVMPKVYYPDGSIQYLCKLLPTPYDWIGRRFNPINSLVQKRNEKFELRFTDYSQLMDVPYLSGCFMFLRISALSEIGLFDEKIFMYGEETDLCRRLIIAGYRTVFNPKVFIIHEFQKGSHKSIRLLWVGIRSAIYYFNKWGWFFDKERDRINQKTLENLSERS